MSDHAKILFFATLRDRAGVRETTIEFPPGSHISHLKNLVLQKYPGIAPIMDTMIVALNHQYAFDEDVVPDGAEIAMFPPVSGGVDSDKNYPTYIAVIEDEIDINKIVAGLVLPTTGATCLFTGIVRGATTRGIKRQTEALIYDAYKEMANLKLLQICAEIRSRWAEVEGIALVQRIGKLMPGTVSVIVACSSSHRDCGIFDAARYGIDRLKEIVPVWKQEIGEDGTTWVEGEYFPHKGD